MTSPSPAASPESLLGLLNRSERRPIASSIRFCGIKFQLRIKLPQAMCGHNKQPIGMPDIKIRTEVAGRVCALPVEAGASVGDGDDVAFVEAMKMEIPVTSPAAGKLKSILVTIDDVVTEGQAVAILET